MSNFKILIVEDEVVIAAHLKQKLILLGYDVCGIAYDGDAALMKIDHFSPDLVLLDINLNGRMDGIEVGESLHQAQKIPFIYLTSHSDKSTLERAKSTRPQGYIVKPFKDGDLLTSIEIALYNWAETFRKKTLDKSVVDRVATTDLTDKEYQIYLDLVQGLNNRQMAEKHFVSVNTIKTHIKRIFTKLEVHDRLAALRKILD